jgi:hypothetical protein
MRRRAPSIRTWAALLAMVLGLAASGAQAGQVRIEGDRIRIDIGSSDGFGVMTALRRHDLVERRQRTLAYVAELKRLGPRMRGARVVVLNHPGGLLNGMAADVSDINALGLEVRIVGRYCNSACTLFLGAQRVCVSPGTSFGFHRPQKPPGTGPMSGATLSAAIQLAGDHYRSGLRDWWERVGSRSRGILSMTGAELTKYGYRICDANNED